MPKYFFSSENCTGATLESGSYYKADKGGMITCDDPSDARALVAGGYVQAGAVARTGKYWVCDSCNWEANLNHCRWCDSEDLRKVSA